MPAHEAGSYTDEEFVWLVRNRLMLHQPQLNAVRGKKCVKEGCSGVLNEEHIMAGLAIFDPKSSIGPRGRKLMAMARGVEWRYLE
jgi:hypothetical protein